LAITITVAASWSSPTERNTALMLAAETGDANAMKVLLALPDVEVNAANGNGHTALHKRTD
jgi:ankyrin repeat protein